MPFETPNRNLFDAQQATFMKANGVVVVICFQMSVNHHSLSSKRLSPFVNSTYCGHNPHHIILRMNTSTTMANL